MKGIHEILENLPKPVVLEVYECEGCEQEVSVTDMAIVGGPDKGKIERFYLGCKCVDKVIEVQVIEN